MPNIRQFAHENGEIHRFNLNLYVGGTSITKVVDLNHYLQDKIFYLNIKKNII